MQPIPSVHQAVVHRAAILQRAANPQTPGARPASPVAPPRRRTVLWDVICLFILMGASLAYALVHLSR